MFFIIADLYVKSSNNNDFLKLHYCPFYLNSLWTQSFRVIQNKIYLPYYLNLNVIIIKKYKLSSENSFIFSYRYQIKKEIVEVMNQQKKVKNTFFVWFQWIATVSNKTCSLCAWQQTLFQWMPIDYL